MDDNHKLVWRTRTLFNGAAQVIMLLNLTDNALSFSKSLGQLSHLRLSARRRIHHCSLYVYLRLNYTSDAQVEVNALLFSSSCCGCCCRSLMRIQQEEVEEGEERRAEHLHAPGAARCWPGAACSGVAWYARGT
jgi:hypothetical protein